MNKIQNKKGDDMRSKVDIKFLLILTILTTACAVEPTKTVPIQYITGQTQYHQVCSNCHGADAMGTRKAPKLIHERYTKENFSNKKIAKTILRGSSSGAMPAQKTKLTEADIKEINKYLRYSQKEIETSIS